MLMQMPAELCDIRAVLHSENESEHFVLLLVAAFLK